MSLKAFHVAFVLVATACALYFGVWSIQFYRDGGGAWYLIAGISSFAVCVVLMIYFKWFLKKLKNQKYL